MPSQHTLEDRHRAAASLVSCCNSIAASRECGIPASTIRHWRQNDVDFALIVQELMAEIGETMKFKYAQIIEESADQALDRLQNGDFVRDKTGELVRVPIRGKDAAIIGAVAFDKLRLAESQPTTIVRHEDSKAQLERLADEFRAISDARR